MKQRLPFLEAPSPQGARRKYPISKAPLSATLPQGASSRSNVTGCRFESRRCALPIGVIGNANFSAQFGQTSGASSERYFAPIHKNLLYDDSNVRYKA
jgi:hypothetical protein